MIQAFPPPVLLYAAKPLAGVAPGARIPRAKESAAAEAFLQSLRSRAPEGASSKSHARGMAAAAAASKGIVGIDLEYRQPGRDIAAIAHWLMGAPARDELSAYRVFTYREAYFKATGDWPEAAALRFVAENEHRGFQTPDGLNVHFAREGELYVLTLVWSALCGASRVAL